jgi:hypothetical protein
VLRRYTSDDRNIAAPDNLSVISPTGHSPVDSSARAQLSRVTRDLD